MLSISGSRVFMTFHENFQASWIYQSTPVSKPGQIITGGVKALQIKFFLPVYLILFGFALYVWGNAITNDFILGLFNNILILLVTANFSAHYLPFSRQPNPKQQSGRFAQVMLNLLFITILVGLHYVVLQFNWLIYLLIPVSAAGCYFLFRRLQHITWLKISF